MFVLIISCENVETKWEKLYIPIDSHQFHLFSLHEWLSAGITPFPDIPHGARNMTCLFLAGYITGIFHGYIMSHVPPNLVSQPQVAPTGITTVTFSSRNKKGAGRRVTSKISLKYLQMDLESNILNFPKNCVAATPKLPVYECFADRGPAIPRGDPERGLHPPEPHLRDPKTFGPLGEVEK